MMDFNLLSSFNISSRNPEMVGVPPAAGAAGRGGPAVGGPATGGPAVGGRGGAAAGGPTVGGRGGAAEGGPAVGGRGGAGADGGPATGGRGGAGAGPGGDLSGADPVRDRDPLSQAALPPACGRQGADALFHRPGRQLRRGGADPPHVRPRL